ncbi:ER membrane protein complex subunit 8/9 homolog [Topomyia yanbarensis]|uniref:ER membrane protein complex subunit 8/9 homolog n=1 Tax=Topomyia yanbarensis TaxID=2498891 RepID=UPI00273C91AE|nr:ER membrane protein complex subunit 8/9 homolog [Topomyia yanbarensis]XP_058818945.1 ER membrane protein complex subunit 8/9 homolog [Topomyia yanbarensis]XP_058818954.1 ER membrane protein complex subunit 8/9 homolog [Topomyia yanbarensis]
MTEVNFSARAYCKIMLHAAKYPHLAVNGLLLGAKASESPTKVLDAVPLFHQCLHVTPMAEIALIQVEAKAAREGLQIIGYYAAAENFYDNSLEKAPGARIADKIAENVSGAVFGVIDNRAVSINMRYPALKVWQNRESRWSKVQRCTVEDSKNTFDAVSSLLQRGAMKELNDFDNYLDNTENDWSNAHLNRDLPQILSMY